MDDVGSGPPASMDRRYDNDAVWHATERLVGAGSTAERLGYDSYWLTEHHFQHEGYEVVPNGLMLGAVIAERTERIRLGMAFNIIPQWHPLRFAEDFSTLHNFSGGRAHHGGLTLTRRVATSPSASGLRAGSRPTDRPCSSMCHPWWTR
jgi:alkanesulfonate monooxygenase SsuD/methylene tetrahydromethanopterin reductase-like flavin-dependent oxidoreductase (luciferase family)